MKVIQTVSEMRAVAESLRAGWKKIGFVPTMGALHDGHLALVGRALEKADVVVTSIYVNPTQFAANEDLTKYPRDIEGDLAKLEAAGCDLVFFPSDSDIYPMGAATYVGVQGQLTESYEGAVRPTHFRGVTTVVAKLFNIVNPHLAVFGRKDAQQVAVIRRMISDMHYDIRLITCETVREPDGLAMSSRNVYLSSEDRVHATTLSRALRAAIQAVASGESFDRARQIMHETIAPVIALDYADIVDQNTFNPADETTQSPLAIIAGKVGGTRLIDNLPCTERLF